MLNRILALITVATLSLAAHAAGAPAVAGKDYTAPERVRNRWPRVKRSRFWSSSGTDARTAPSLNRGSTPGCKSLPTDAQIRRVPAVFRDDWMQGAKIYYTLQDLGAVDKLHAKGFDAYHVERLNLNDEAVLMTWVAKQGLDRTKFEAAYKSFSTQSRATQGGMLARAYNLSGVPSFAIDGKYVTSESMTEQRATTI